jgi:hypothetical protein
MDAWLVVLLVFVVGGVVVVLVAISINSEVNAQLKLPGRAEFYIDTSRDEWRKRASSSGDVEQRHSANAPPRSSPKPRFYLEMNLKHGPNWIFPLDGKSQVYIGRRQDNTLKLTDSTADTRQAVIYWEDGRYKINNLSSRVPTKVNNHKFTRQNLGDGNTITMGRTKLIFRDRSKHS